MEHNQSFHYFSALEEVQNVQTDNQQADEYNIIASQRVRIVINENIVKPLESGMQATGTSFLDLNDDCLYESLKWFSIMDLCSIARTSSRLRDIANTIFTKNFKQINLKSSVNTIQEARILIATFGSLISELWLSSHLGPESRTGIFDLVTKCCSDSLKSLRLYNYDVPECVMIKSTPIFSNLQKLNIKHCTIDGASKYLFGDCESLVELVVIGQDEDIRFISDNTFPQLKRFYLKRRVDLSLRNFISRHKNLQSLNITSYDDCSFLLPIIVGNCKQLENFSVGSQNIDSVTHGDALSSLLTLKHLTKLRIDCHSGNVTKFTKELSALKSLKLLELANIHGDPELLPALSQLKQLRILRFDSMLNEHRQELNMLYQLDQLRELSIRVRGFVDVDIKLNFDIVCLVEHLTKLISLKIFIETFELDKKAYLKIVEILRQRVNSDQQTFEMKCFTDEDITENLQYNNRSIIKLN